MKKKPGKETTTTKKRLLDPFKKLGLPSGIPRKKKKIPYLFLNGVCPQGIPPKNRNPPISVKHWFLPHQQLFLDRFMKKSQKFVSFKQISSQNSFKSLADAYLPPPLPGLDGVKTFTSIVTAHKG